TFHESSRLSGRRTSHHKVSPRSSAWPRSRALYSTAAMSTWFLLWLIGKKSRSEATRLRSAAPAGNRRHLHWQRQATLGAVPGTVTDGVDGVRSGSLSGWRTRRASPASQPELDDRRHHRNKDDRDDDQVEVILDHRQLAELVAAEQENRD